MTDITILLVEDNQDDEELARWVLGKIGISRISVAKDGVEAVERLLGSHPVAPLPDLVLLDLRLPKIDGIDVLQRLRTAERTKALPVVALTSSEDPKDKRLCHSLGVLAFLSKPLNEQSLLAVIG